MLLGLAHFRLQNDDEAIPALKRALEIERVDYPETAQVGHRTDFHRYGWLVLAMAQHRAGQVDKAAETLKKAREVRLGPIYDVQMEKEAERYFGR